MSMPFPQENFVTDWLAAHPQVGRLVWFTVADQTVGQTAWLEAIMQAGLASYGVPGDIAPTTAYLRGLRALQHTVPARTLIRRVIRERGRTVHHWIRETVVQDHVEFQVLAAIDRDTRHDAIAAVHRFPALQGTEDDALNHLPEFVEAARQSYTPGDRRRQVRAWLARGGALAMTAAGPVTFVPEEAAGLIQALTQGQDALGLQVWSMPLQRSGDVIATLTQSLDAEVTQKTAALLQRVQDARTAGQTPTVGQQAKLVAALHDLDTRVQRYAGLFGDQLTALTSQIGIAKQAVRQALET